MAEFVKAGQRLINIDHVVDIFVWHQEEDEDALIVDVVTTATLDTDPTDEQSSSKAYIVLEDEEAREFLGELHYRKSGPNGTGARKASELAKRKGGRE